MEALISSALAGVATIAGISLVARWRDWTVGHSHLVNSFAAGVIIGTAFFNLLPEAMESSSFALPLVVAGFLLLNTIETFAVFHGGAELRFHTSLDGHHSKVWVMFCGLFLHSLIDGLIIGIGFEAGHAVGILAAISVILHELPEGAITFALLTTGLKMGTAWKLSVAVALATPAGALMSAMFLRGIPHEILGMLLAVAAGSFIYIGASDLVPETHSHKAWVNALLLIAGAGIAYLLSQFLHAH